MVMTRIAIVGAGNMAREHIRAFQSLDGVEVTGIHSRTTERARKLAEEFGIAHVCDSIQQLKERSEADLVVVTVPELSANAVAKQCFASDWAVLLEKPAGYDLADAEDIAAAARGRSKPVLVGFNRRFYASTQAVRADLESRPDELRYVHVQDQQSYEEARRYNHPEKVVEKFMYANSIHNIDLIMALCRGEPVEVRPVMPWKGEETEVVLVHIVFDSGDTALYEGIWKGPGPWACAVSTPSRRWTMQPLERATFQNRDSRAQNQVEPEKRDIDFKAGFVSQAQAVLAAMRGEPSKATDIDESLRTMRLIHKMFGV